MFTGIIETVGIIKSVHSDGGNKTFDIESNISSELHIDQSVSHDGVCLTIEQQVNGSHTVTMIKETLDRTNFANRQVGDSVNLERCIKMSDRLDGHMVQGHVDTSVSCERIVDQDGSWDLHFNLPQNFRHLVVSKGSICINGISLTISALTENTFGVSIIPYTFENTNVSDLEPGSVVNVEFDILGKYVERQLVHYKKQ